MALGGDMMKTAMSKAVVIKINLAFLAFFLVAYVALLFQPSFLRDENAASVVRCSLRGCHMKKVGKEVMSKKAAGEKRAALEKPPSFIQGSHGNMTIGLMNMEDDEVKDWGALGRSIAVDFEQVSELFEWKDLFPEWIDEEEENEGATCPEIPMPDFSVYEEMDMVVARLPCRRPEEGWARDVFRLQTQLVAANLAVRRGRRDGRGVVKVVFLSACRPMMELFQCDDLVGREGDWWMYEAQAARLEEKVTMPVGSCNLALPLWGEGTNEEYDVSKFAVPVNPHRREAYATVLHSTDNYVCGAIMLAQSILKTGSTRDLILLHDKSIPQPKLQALVAAGWTLREITRIRNPHAQKNSYNEYNYSKLRLWLLTEYHKIVFIDADIVVLRSLDLLFHFPQMSATGNDGVIFNSGIMVIEPSNCTFQALMGRREDVISYNGGDQGFLNEVFVWWHRLPRRVNFLKNFWSNSTLESSMKNHLFAAEPPKLYSIHYLGLKPWLCYRDYDCNWNIDDQRVYASDEAHRRWWRLHDQMDEGLRAFCGLSPQRRIELDWDRKKAAERGFPDGHWKLNISDWRRNV
ncbi:UDP-glucuronate:xylan alpha-glucuronosyltransferase 2 isoform X1 [Elaeis guineensis]|uniref:Hexosyltransferase n=2 Tax=Elaeis guineensis var. tenera TaxID=51953 RepID=A0A6I9R235_ELAGV|nr:UDP-glucuronate:xylan alpha-glucuronosyltransferase 2 isoform X1 [Elaeis guineensis]